MFFKDKRSLRRSSYLHSFSAKALAVAIYHYAIECCHARSVTSSSHYISKLASWLSNESLAEEHDETINTSTTALGRYFIMVDFQYEFNDSKIMTEKSLA